MANGLENDLSTGSMIGYLFQVIIVLIIIIGLIVLLIKFLSQKNKRWSSGRSIRQLGGITLGQNKSLQVVEIGQAIYLIGVGESIQLIDKIEQADEVAYLIQSLTSAERANEHGLTSIRDWITSRFKPSSPSDEFYQTSESPDAFQYVLQDKLKQVSHRKEQVEQLLRGHHQQNGRTNDEE